MLRTLDHPALRPSALRDLATFMFVGGAGAILFVALSSLVIELNTGIPDWVVSAACWAALIVPVYLLHRSVSFRSDAPHGQALPRYVGVQLVGVALSGLFSYVAHTRLGMPSVVGGFVVAALTAAVNYVVLRTWAFAAR